MLSLLVVIPKSLRDPRDPSVCVQIEIQFLGDPVHVFFQRAGAYEAHTAPLFVGESLDVEVDHGHENALATESFWWSATKTSHLRMLTCLNSSSGGWQEEFQEAPTNTSKNM